MTVVPPVPGRSGAGRSYRILSTFPPTPCGLATFTAALGEGLVANGAAVGVVRVADGSGTSNPMVLGELENNVPSSVADAAARLDDGDVAIVQHEYGLYGGVDGDEVLEIVQALSVPCIVIAHTVLLEPSDHQRAVLTEIARAASAVVVMSESARGRLRTGFDVDDAKVVTIPHGAATPPFVPSPGPAARPMLLTWGLLGAGKGIEWAIDALAELRDVRPRPHYVVAGRTHPKVLAHEGERYREMLIRRAWHSGVAASVTFDDSYRDVPSLTALIQQASVVVLPYDSQDQVTSGVLVDAVAAGRPVVATAFPHAIELLSGGAGIVVPHGNSAALAYALRRVLTEPGLADEMREEAAALAPSLGWPSVARQYAALGDRLLSAVAAR
jgi:glycosyltransferase involved in cell wall biosynthesis